MEASKIFFEKALLNLVRKLTKSYAYENVFKQMLNYRGYLFSESEEVQDVIEAFLKKKRAAQKETTTKYDDDFDFPICPTKYLTQDDIDLLVQTVENSHVSYKADFKIETNTQTIADMLDLTSTETLVLQTSIFFNRMTYPWDAIFSSMSYSSEFEEVGRVYELMFNLTSAEARDMLKGFLFNSGFMVPNKRYRCFHSITAEMAEIFSGDLKFDENTISNVLFPACIKTELTTDDYPHLSKELDRVEAVVNQSLKTNTPGVNLMFWGIPGTGKTELTIALAQKYGWDLKIIGDISKTDMNEKSRAQRLTSLKIAMKLYQKSTNTVLLFDEMEDLFKREDTNASFSKAFINRIIETTPIPIIWTTNDLMSLGNATLRRMTYNVGFDVPPASARKKIWQNYISKYEIDISEETVDELARTYDIAPALISNAAKIVHMANLKDNDSITDIIQSLDCLVNYGSKRTFTPVKMKDTPYDASWVNTKTDLNILTRKLLNANPNWSLCLYGPSGTGKSEYGRYIAKELGRRVLYKRVSDLQSMWVGECEKNIAKMFKQAHDEEMLIILDEGETFLQNREGAQRSWEISQVNEMLSQMENHDQPFIMTTNLMGNLDPAALRRFTFKMDFQFLREDQLPGIYSAYFGHDLPKKLEKIDILTPGDLAAVLKRVKVMGNVEQDEIVEMLLDDVKLKPQFRKSMGF